MNIKKLIKKVLHKTGYTIRKLDGPEGTVYDHDGLLSIHNHDFMKNGKFISAYVAGSKVDEPKPIYWRLHTILWAAHYASKLEGDFIECGVFKGMYSRAVMSYIHWEAQQRIFYLYDLYEGSNFDTYEEVVKTFAPFPNVRIVKGSVPESMTNLPDKIAYASIDMNAAHPEIEAFRLIWDRLVPGAIIVLDDYAYRGYYAQYLAWNEVVKEKGIEILSLPTGQGLIIKEGL